MFPKYLGVSFPIYLVYFFVYFLLFIFSISYVLFKKRLHIGSCDKSDIPNFTQQVYQDAQWSRYLDQVLGDHCHQWLCLTNSQMHNTKCFLSVHVHTFCVMSEMEWIKIKVKKLRKWLKIIKT